MYVCIFNNVCDQAKPFRHTLTCTKSSKVADTRVDAAHGVALVVLVPLCVGPCCDTGFQEVYLTLPASFISQGRVSMYPRQEFAEVV